MVKVWQDMVWGQNFRAEQSGACLSIRNADDSQCRNADDGQCLLLCWLYGTRKRGGRRRSRGGGEEEEAVLSAS